MPTANDYVFVTDLYGQANCLQKDFHVKGVAMKRMCYQSHSSIRPADVTGVHNHISRVLITEPVPDYFNVTAMQNEAVKRKFCIERTALLSPNYDLANLAGVTLNTTASPHNLAKAFSIASRIQEHRIAKGTHVPITIVNCSWEMSPSTKADFLQYGCYVVSHASPEQIVDLLETALVDAGRRSRRGLTLAVWPGFLPVITYAGRQQEIEIKGRLFRLLTVFCRERREFPSVEISAMLNCEINQVKVYVDRLRRLIVAAGCKIGVCIGKHEVIQNSGKKGGYRLHANVEGLLFPE
jgi:hypothetical protein